MSRWGSHINQLLGKADRELVDSVLQVSVEANKQIVEELMGDDNMCEALMEIMEPWLLLKQKEAEKKEREKGIRISVEVFRDIGQKDTEIKTILVEKFGLSVEEAEEYLRERV